MSEPITPIEVIIKDGESLLHFRENTVEFWAPGLVEGEAMTSDETVGAGLFVLIKNKDPLLHSMINKALEAMGNVEDGSDEGEGSKD